MITLEMVSQNEKLEIQSITVITSTGNSRVKKIH